MKMRPRQPILLIAISALVLVALPACEESPATPVGSVFLWEDPPVEGEQFPLEGKVRFDVEAMESEVPDQFLLKLTIRTETLYPTSTNYKIIAEGTATPEAVVMHLKYVVIDPTEVPYRSPDHAWIRFGITTTQDQFQLMFADGDIRDAFTVELGDSEILVSPDSGAVAILGI